MIDYRVHEKPSTGRKLAYNISHKSRNLLSYAHLQHCKHVFLPSHSHWVFLHSPFFLLLPFFRRAGESTFPLSGAGKTISIHSFARARWRAPIFRLSVMSGCRSACLPFSSIRVIECAVVPTILMQVRSAATSMAAPRLSAEASHSQPHRRGRLAMRRPFRS